jgi:hypothetical protein
MTPPSAQPPDKPQYDLQVLLKLATGHHHRDRPRIIQGAFQNHASITTFGDMLNLTCYKNIAGCATPCSFCKMPKPLRRAHPQRARSCAERRIFVGPLGEGRKRRRTAPQPSNNLDHGAGIDGASDSARSSLHAASESPPFPFMPPFRRTWSLLPMRQFTSRRGRGKTGAHSESCRPFPHRSLRPLYGPKARVTVLWPRMRGSH